MLQDLLQNAPNLETLVVTEEYTYDKSNLCCKEPPYDRDYLSSRLTSFYYGGFEGAQQHVYLELNEVYFFNWSVFGYIYMAPPFMSICPALFAFV
nr:hypothetical protein CFP56_12507 [Quercus suber]